MLLLMVKLPSQARTALVMRPSHLWGLSLNLPSPLVLLSVWNQTLANQKVSVVQVNHLQYPIKSVKLFGSGSAWTARTFPFLRSQVKMSFPVLMQSATVVTHNVT